MSDKFVPRSVGLETRERLLTAQCWCMTEFVLVKATDVQAGLTRPCKRRDCLDADRRHRDPAH